MPIRINLLAEAQAAEDMRRRDPVKRAAWAGGFLVVLMILWSISLQMRGMLAQAEVNRVESQLASKSNLFYTATEQQKQLTDVETKLKSLVSLGTNRLLYGNMLDALQHSMVNDVQLMRLRVEQNYALTEGVKGKTNGSGKLTPAQPPTSTEKIVVSLEARDMSPVPGDQVNRYRSAISSAPYFKERLKTNEVRLDNLSAPQVGPDSKTFVMFTLECKFPEVKR